MSSRQIAGRNNYDRNRDCEMLRVFVAFSVNRNFDASEPVKFLPKRTPFDKSPLLPNFLIFQIADNISNVATVQIQHFIFLVSWYWFSYNFSFLVTVLVFSSTTLFRFFRF